LALAVSLGCRHAAPGTADASDLPPPTALSAPAPPVAEIGFAGAWQTTYGLLRLAPGGSGLTGSYTFARGSRIEGAEEGRVLRGTYHEPARRDGLGAIDGRFAFELAEDGESFRGVWAEGPGAPLDLADAALKIWTGRRARGEPDRVWLVILEENWEGSLRDHEYSFGAMLRAFFERVPNVAVRHRFVHDRADFDRFCAELAELLEPVFLYVSSHGSPQALSIGQDGIAPEQLGAALRNAGDLRLLHLGACAMLAGDAPARIRAAAAPHPPFPISGFVESVDWAASAIVDFTYLSLLLERGLEPAAAVAATREMLQFANPPGESRGVLPGCDLRVAEATEGESAQDEGAATDE
jgi:hypothetical protein